MAFIPSGVKDTLSKESEKKDKLIGRLKSLYRSFGYRKIETPTFEYYDTFTEIKNTVDKDKTLKIIDSDGKILVLRPDITTPIIRTVESNYQIEDNLKFYYDMNIFRISQNDDKKEKTQVGIEFIAKQSSFIDAEAIALAIKSLIECKIEDFQIDIGQTEYLKGLLEGVDKREEIKRAIANKNIIGLREILKELEVYGEQKNAILNVPYLYGDMDYIKEKLTVHNKRTNEAIENLKETYEILKSYGYEKYVSFDLGMVQGLNYYCGIIFRGYIKGYGKPVLSGGRYGNLLKDFTGVGFGIDIDSIMQNTKEQISIKSDYVVIGSDYKKIIEKSNELREKGYIVESMLKGPTKIEGNIIDIDELGEENG